MEANETAKAEEFVISRVFRAPRPRVWDAWTKPDQLSRWFGPKGVTTTVQAHELRPGGVLHARMDTPDGGRMWARFFYREISAPSRLVWIHCFSDEHAGVVRAPFFDGNWPLELLTTVTFADEGPATRVTLTWAPLNATEIERRTFAANMGSMNQGWTGSFEVLDGLLGGA
ncbi:SRPBCC family protein [Rhodopila sp.]|uniref:SRPBCC family protein n=1 Tax=Rhodopila sp. TaxID=2480087 RepID=UPI003D0E88BF